MKEEALKYIEDNTEYTYVREIGLDGLRSRGLDPDKKYFIEPYYARKAVDIAIKGMLEKPVWIKIDEKHPLPKFTELLAFNEEWIDPDFNQEGVRIGWLGEDGFTSALYESENDTYTYCQEEGDDYQTSSVDESGVRHTWYTNKDGERTEGYRPNLPTHYMLIPSPMKNMPKK